MIKWRKCPTHFSIQGNPKYDIFHLKMRVDGVSLDPTKHLEQVLYMQQPNAKCIGHEFAHDDTGVVRANPTSVVIIVVKGSIGSP